MSNRVESSLAMPVALVIFGVLILLGMKSIADGITTHALSVSKAIEVSLDSPFQLEMLGLDKVMVELNGTEDGKPIILQTKLFN